MLRLKEIRTASGETQAKIAAVIGVTRAAYANIENGKREPDFKAVLMLADYFDVTLDYLFGRSEKATQVPSQSPNLSATEQTLLCTFRQLNSDGQGRSMEYLNYLLDTGRYSTDAKAKTSA